MKKLSALLTIITLVIIFSSCTKEETKPQVEENLVTIDLTSVAELPYPEINSSDITDGGVKSGITTIQLIAFERFVIQDGDEIIRRFAWYMIQDQELLHKGYAFQIFENGNWDEYEMEYIIGFNHYDGYSIPVTIRSTFELNESFCLHFSHKAGNDFEGDLMYLKRFYWDNEHLHIMVLFPPIDDFMITLQVGSNEHDALYYQESFDPEDDEEVIFDAEFSSNIHYRIKIQNLNEADIMTSTITYNGTYDEIEYTQAAQGTYIYLDSPSFPNELFLAWYYIDENNLRQFIDFLHVDEFDVYGIDPNGVILLEPED